MNLQLSLRSALCLLGLTVSLLAADTPPKIADLAAWSVLGADKGQLTQSETLTLPAGAQLYRTVPSGAITLTVQSSPVFGPTAAALPVLELGDIALAFLRDGAAGKLVLVLANNPALTLPYEIPLASDGHSQAPLSLTLSRAGATVAVTTGGQTLHFPAGYTASPQEIVLSAGAGQAWPIQGLTLTATANLEPNHSDAGASVPVQGQADQIRQQVADRSDANGGAASIAGDDVVIADHVASPVASAESQARPTLEIFTPPSVRPGRATAVRAAVIESLKQ